MDVTNIEYVDYKFSKRNLEYIHWRSYEIINESYFCVRHKNRPKHNQHFKTVVFHNKFALSHIKPNIYIKKTKFASNKQYLFHLLTSRNTKKTQTDQSIPRVFLLYLKRNDPQTFKSGSWKFSSVYVVGTTCFDECFLFYVITGRHYFSWEFINTTRFF